MRELVTCESTAAITLHLRSTREIPVSLSGFATRPRALCGAEVAWDTRIQVSAASCCKCLEVERGHR